MTIEAAAITGADEANGKWLGSTSHAETPNESAAR